MDSKEKSSGLFSSFGVKEAASIGIAALVTSVQAWFAIGRRMGSNFEEMAQEVDNKAYKIQDALRKNLAQLSDNPSLHGKALAEKMGKIYRDHETAVKGYWTERSITGISGKLKSFKPHQRLEVLFGAVAVFTVSLGVTIGIAKSQELSNIFGRHSQNQDIQK